MRRGGEMGDTVGRGGKVLMEGGGDEKGRGNGRYGWEGGKVSMEGGGAEKGRGDGRHGWEGREGIDGGRWS